MRQDVYRVAFDEAAAELTEIRGRFEQLLMRKTRLEGVIAVLGPLLGGTGTGNPGAAGTEPQRAASSAAEGSPYSFNQVSNPLPDLDETGGDPFKRRIRNALRTTPLGTEQPGLQTAV